MSFYVGLDLGQAADFTALAVLEAVSVEEVEGKLHLRYLERYPLRTPYTAVADGVVALVEKLRDLTVLGDEPDLLVDNTGVGKAVTDVLRDKGLRFKAITLTGGSQVMRGDAREYRVPKADVVDALVHVRGFYGEKTRSNLSPATVTKMHVVLRKALSHAVSDGLISRNAVDSVKPPRVSAPGEEIKPLNPEECAAFLKASCGETLEALYVLAVHCGLREGELLALRWEEADLEAAKPALLVRRTLTRGEDGRGWVVGGSTKSGKGRRVRLTQQAVAVLKQHRKRQLEERMRLAGLWQDHGLVFPNEMGFLFNPLNLRNRSFKRIKARSGVREDLRFHDLRHTCATLLLSEGVNVKVVSEMLGHASITITLNTYAHVLPDMQDSAAEAMEAAFGAMS